MLRKMDVGKACPSSFPPSPPPSPHPSPPHSLFTSRRLEIQSLLDGRKFDVEGHELLPEDEEVFDLGREGGRKGGREGGKCGPTARLESKAEKRDICTKGRRRKEREKHARLE